MDVTGSIRKKERSVGPTSAAQLRPGKQRRMALVAFVVLAATVVAGSEASSRCQSNSSSRQHHRMFGNEAVIRHILEDYQRLGRPARGMEEVEVSLKAGLMSIDGLVEQDELFSFTAWLTFVWRDPRLTWGSGSSGGEAGSAESHGPSSSSCQDDLNLEDVNVTSLILPQSAIWTPTILVSNSVTGFQDLASSDFEAGQVVIERDGLVTWIIGDRFDVRCSVNTHKFPFDEQVCFAEFTTDTVLYGHINLQLDTTTVNCSAYRPNAEYELMATHLTSEAYFGWRRAVRLQVAITRRWMQYVFQGVLPVLLISFLNTSVFLLPPDCGERVSFSVALLLSYVIFMSSISSTLPPNSLTVCLYSLYLAALTLLSTVSAAANVAIIACYKHRRAGGQVHEAEDSPVRQFNCHGRHCLGADREKGSMADVSSCCPSCAMAPAATSDLFWRKTAGNQHRGDDVSECPPEEPEIEAHPATCSHFCRSVSVHDSANAHVSCPLAPPQQDSRRPPAKEKVSTLAFGVSLAVTVFIHSLFLGLLVT